MESNNITKLVSLLYCFIVVGLPLFYLMVYIGKAKKIKRRKKKYLKGVIITIFMFSILLGVKYIFKLTGETKMNCYINNICMNKSDVSESTTTKKETSEVKTTEEVKTSSISKTTTSSQTTTSSKTTTSTTKTSVTTSKISIGGNKKIVGTSKKGYTIYEIDGVTYIDGYLIANKSYFLPKDFVPTNPHKPASPTSTKQCADCIDKDAYKAWGEMKADATALGLNIWIQSGYRSYVLQGNLYNRYVNRDGKQKADTYSARPGSSEHQTGLCFDLNSISDAFARTNEGKWVDKNAYRYGFIIRYPKGKSDETGYKYESWHLRYVGKELAEKLYNNGDWITMEEWFGITSSYSE